MKMIHGQKKLSSKKGINLTIRKKQKLKILPAQMKELKKQTSLIWKTTYPKIC